MKFYICILLIIRSFQSYSQIADPESLNVFINKPLTVSYSSIDELCLPKVINNAIALKLKVKEYNKSISAQVNFNNINPADVPPGWVILKLTSQDSYNAIINKYETALSSTPTLLFIQPGSTDNEPQFFTFYFDIVLSPQYVFINPSSYNYSITFTMTEQ